MSTVQPSVRDDVYAPRVADLPAGRNVPFVVQRAFGARGQEGGSISFFYEPDARTRRVSCLRQPWPDVPADGVCDRTRRVRGAGVELRMTNVHARAPGLF